jgi:hypothetical protein
VPPCRVDTLAHGGASGKRQQDLHFLQHLWHNHPSAMTDHDHSTRSTPAGTAAGRSSYAGGSWRFYAWRFI